MDEGNSSGSRFMRFWTTLPGVLTAIAAVITAVGGLYFAFREDKKPPPPSSEGREITINLVGQGGTEPSVPADVSGSQLNLASLDSTSALEAEVAGMVNDCAAGDDSACQELLDNLVDECDRGFGVSCDALYQVTAEGSDYEYFGATCGGRVGSENAGRCAQL